MYTSSWRLNVGAINNVVDIMTYAASTSGEGQSTRRSYEKIFRYKYRQLSATTLKAPAGEGQTREAASYFCWTLLSNPGNWKKCNEARLTSFNVCTPSTQCLIT